MYNNTRNSNSLKPLKVKFKIFNISQIHIKPSCQVVSHGMQSVLHERYTHKENSCFINSGCSFQIQFTSLFNHPLQRRGHMANYFNRTFLLKTHQFLMSCTENWPSLCNLLLNLMISSPFNYRFW